LAEYDIKYDEKNHERFVQKLKEDNKIRSVSINKIFPQTTMTLEKAFPQDSSTIVSFERHEIRSQKRVIKEE
jgi:hypothetical protein